MERQKIALLDQINSGICIFEPARRRSKDVVEFQETARHLLELEKAGLIGKCVVREAEIAGISYFDMLYVCHGLTGAGQAALQQFRKANHV